MFTESFHRLLKVVYLNNKQNRRVDWLIHVLLRIARNLVYEQLQKIEKGKTTHRKTEIHKRHKAAMELNPTLQPTNDKTWRIQSYNKKDTYYILNKLLENCSCKLHCSMCHACVHMYSCTCMDATLHYTVCKHIHFLHMSINQQEEEENMENKDELENANGDYEKKDEQDTIENEDRNEGVEYNETEMNVKVTTAVIFTSAQLIAVSLTHMNISLMYCKLIHSQTSLHVRPMWKT